MRALHPFAGGLSCRVSYYWAKSGGIMRTVVALSTGTVLWVVLVEAVAPPIADQGEADGGSNTRSCPDTTLMTHYGVLHTVFATIVEACHSTLTIGRLLDRCSIKEKSTLPP